MGSLLENNSLQGGFAVGNGGQPMLNRFFIGLVVNAAHLLLAQAARTSAVVYAVPKSCAADQWGFSIFPVRKKRVKQVIANDI